MTVGHKLAVVGAAFALGLFPLGTRASAIMGNTTGQTVTVPPTASHPRNRDDADTATTTDISYINVSPFITNGASAYPSYHFVFAGQPGIGSQFQPISPSDFTIVQYNPWVVNNNRNTNGVTGPDGINYNRGITNRDAGGADILILYTPLNAGDPTRVNFVQAFAQNTNSTGLSQGTIDAGGSTRPYYNVAGLSGTGTTNRTGTSPLVTSPNAPAWMVDIPGRCENGPLPAGPPEGCLRGADETITSQVQVFQTFVEADRTVGGQTYQVLYGGIQWGYTYITEDRIVPEPATATLLGVGALGVILAHRRARVRNGMGVGA